jgi:hypothetical protein
MFVYHTFLHWTNVARPLNIALFYTPKFDLLPHPLGYLNRVSKGPNRVEKGNKRKIKGGVGWYAFPSLFDTQPRGSLFNKGST